MVYDLRLMFLHAFLSINLAVGLFQYNYKIDFDGKKTKKAIEIRNNYLVFASFDLQMFKDEC